MNLLKFRKISLKPRILKKISSIPEIWQILKNFWKLKMQDQLKMTNKHFITFFVPSLCIY